MSLPPHSPVTRVMASSATLSVAAISAGESTLR